MLGQLPLEQMVFSPLSRMRFLTRVYRLPPGRGIFVQRGRRNRVLVCAMAVFLYNARPLISGGSDRPGPSSEIRWNLLVEGSEVGKETGR